jgi:catechol-2,3-dioxygenase
VLGGHVAYEDAHLGFVTYDDEHHRVGFVGFVPLTLRDRDADLGVPPTDPPGLHDVAFTFGSMGELLENYTRLAARGIRPFRSIDHGPTTSMHYADPDGNCIELRVDHFAIAKEGPTWMRSPCFERNPIGVEFDPDELVERFRSGW